jgi:hypothetical protein
MLKQLRIATLREICVAHEILKRCNMNDQGIFGGTSFNGIYGSHRLFVGCISAKPVNGLSWKGYELSIAQQLCGVLYLLS